MKNKKITILLLILLTTISNIYCQLSSKTEFFNAARDHLSYPMKKGTIDYEKITKTSNLRYLFVSYKKAYISNSKKVSYLRYNIFADAMEFVKDDEIYNLNKTENQIIDFFVEKKKYGVFNFEGEKTYFQIKHSGKNSILIKQIVEFDKGKKAVSQFDVEVNPKFFRKKDKVYIAFDNKNLKEIPKRKKAFYKIFNDKAAAIKKYMKLNKLTHKENDDLVLVLNYFNSLK